MKLANLIVASSIILCFAGCKIISNEEYQKLQSPESPYLTQASKFFDTKLVHLLESKAHSPVDLINRINSINDFNKACAELGYREGPDLQCNFAVKVTGVVTKVSNKSRRGSLILQDEMGNSYKIQTGPVISGTSLRDVQSEVGYKEFNDQTVYGEFAKRLNARSVEISSEQSPSVGDKYEIIGAFSSWDVPTSTIQITPVKYIKQ